MKELAPCPKWIEDHISNALFGESASYIADVWSDIREAAAVKSVIAGIDDIEAWHRAYTGYCHSTGIKPRAKP